MPMFLFHRSLYKNVCVACFASNCSLYQNAFGEHLMANLIIATVTNYALCYDIFHREVQERQICQCQLSTVNRPSLA